VNYFNAQIPVLDEISSCIQILNSSKNSLFMKKNIEDIVLKLSVGKNNLNLKELINNFGSNGLDLVVKTIIDNLKDIRNKNAECSL
jgi:hypothetical protein